MTTSEDFSAGLAHREINRLIPRAERARTRGDAAALRRYLARIAELKGALAAYRRGERPNVRLLAAETDAPR